MRRCKAFPPVKESPTLFARSKRKPTKWPPKSPQTVWPPTSRKYLWQDLEKVIVLKRRKCSERRGTIDMDSQKSVVSRRTNPCRNKSMSDPKQPTLLSNKDHKFGLSFADSEGFSE